MIGDITLGQYFPGNSVLHRLDPRMKLVLCVLAIACIFTASSALSYAVAVVFTFAVVALSGVPVKMYAKSLKPLVLVILFIAFFNLFAYPEDPLFTVWVFSVSVQGIVFAVKMAVRLILLMLVTSALTYTTSPILLAGGLESLLTPLALIGVPVHDFAMMLTIALRFIPTLTDETEKIVNAQKARGADFENGGLIKRVKSVVPIIVPLFVSCFRHADELAEAMLCRCYTGSARGRTRYVRYTLRVSDFVALALAVGILVLVIFTNRVMLGGF